MTAVDMDALAGFPSSNILLGDSNPQIPPSLPPPLPPVRRVTAEEAQDEPLLQEIDESRSPDEDVIPVGSPFPASR